MASKKSKPVKKAAAAKKKAAAPKKKVAPKKIAPKKKAAAKKKAGSRKPGASRKPDGRPRQRVAFGPTVAPTGFRVVCDQDGVIGTFPDRDSANAFKAEHLRQHRDHSVVVEGFQG